MIYHIKRATKHLLVWLLIALAVSITVLRFALLGVADYKADLESKIYQLTSIPIKIGQLKANMRGFSPEIILKGIEILEPTADIQLEELRLGIDLAQLLATRQILPSSWLTLVGVKLSIERKEDGSLSIVGLNSGDSEQPLWLVEGGRYEVLKSEITWHDKQRHALPITFKNVDLLIKNDAAIQQHEIHLISQLPKKYGQSLRVSMAIKGDLFEVDSIDGTVYVEGEDIHLAQLLTGDLPLDLKIDAGDGGFKLWSQFKSSKLVSLSGTINAKNIALQHQQNKLDISEFKTTFNSDNHKDGIQFGLSDLLIKTADYTWPAAKFVVSINNDLTQIAASIAQLDLQESMELFNFFSSNNERNQSLISSLVLNGTLKDLTVFIDNKQNQYVVNGDFVGVSMDGGASLPQLKNITGSIKGSNETGTIALNTVAGSLFFPQLFKQAHVINQLQGLVNWQQMADQWILTTEKLVLETADVQTQTSLALTISKKDLSPILDMQTSFSMQDINKASLYYPVDIMDKDLVDWLTMALVSGNIPEGKLLVYGGLEQFPFVDGQGTFEVLFNMEDAHLKYAPGWPLLTNLNADVLFFKDGLKVDVASADVMKMKIKPTSVGIPSFEKSHYVFVNGQAGGEIIDVLGFMQKSPLHQMFDNILSVISAKGTTQADVDIKIPLDDGFPEQVNGVAHFNDAVINISNVDLNINNVSGDLKFTEKGVFSENIKAKTLGYPIKVAVDSEESKTLINISGQTNVPELKKQFSFLQHDSIKGSEDSTLQYQLVVDIPNAENKLTQLNIKTDLLGLALNLPKPLQKTVKQRQKLDLNLWLDDNDFLPLKMNYGNQLNAAIKIDKQKNTVYSGHIVYGNNLHATHPNKKGIKIQIKQKDFDASEWLGAVAKGNGAESVVNSISLETQNIQWQGKSYGSLDLSMQKVNKQWIGNLASSAAKGAFILPASKKQKIKLEMQSLNLTELMKFSSAGKKVSTANFPAVSMHSEQLWWKSIDLGRLDIDVEPMDEGVRFNKIDITSNMHKLEMKADWLKTKKGHVTEVYGQLMAEDTGSLLSTLNLYDDLKETQSNIGFFGRWIGSPYQFSVSSVDAEIDFELNDGRLSSIEPGFGRILGLLAMEQWIKRLTLDFSDIYKQGLSFNNISGHLKLKSGMLMTKDLRVDAIPAKISISGDVDLQEKTFNHLIQVVPKSAGAVPIAGTIVSKIAGVITQALTNDYQEGYFFGSKYKVTGKWGNMLVTPIHEQDGLFKKTWTGIVDFPWADTLIEE